MLRLFYSPGACSLVTHIALEETGAEFEAVRVVLAQGEHRTPEYLAINPHARVPTLANSHGILTENIAILNLIADIFGAPGSVPRGDPFATARCNELLGWFASSVHISFAQVWRGERFTVDQGLWPAIKAGGIEAIEKHFAEIEERSAGGWLAAGQFTAADSYALTFFRWGRRIGMDMSRFPAWTWLYGQVLERAAVRQVLDREGLKEDEFLPELVLDQS
jgi:glutathione S-transferase